MTSGKGDVEDPMYSGEASHGTQVMKMHDRNEIFSLIVAFEVDELRLITSRTLTILISMQFS